MAGNSIDTVVSNYIHDGKQVLEDQRAILLTVGRIGTLVGKGSLDFGGSEYTPAPTAWQEPIKKNGDDKYGWWHLEAGSYLLEFNESLDLPPGEQALLQVWVDAARTGLTHPTELVTGSRQPLSTVIQVPNPGVDIKENARVSQLTLI